MEYWETEFKNERQQRVSVLENGGQELLHLAPGETKFVESKSPTTSYAPWYKIVFLADGTVELHQNVAWDAHKVWPGKLILEIFNRDGTLSETFYDGNGEAIHCYRGIPRFTPIDIGDTTWNCVKKLEIKLVEVSEQQGDYVKKRKVLQQVRTPRTPTEIASIKKQLLGDAVRAKKMQLKYAFLRQER